MILSQENSALLCTIKSHRGRCILDKKQRYERVKKDEMGKNGRMIFLHLLWTSIALMMGVYSCNSGIDDMGVFVGGILICSAIINVVLLYAISVTECGGKGL